MACRPGDVGGGYGLIGDLIVGLIGAFIGDWLLPQLGIHLGTGIIALILNAFIGAVVLLLILRLVSGGFRPRPGGAGAGAGKSHVVPDSIGRDLIPRNVKYLHQI